MTIRSYKNIFEQFVRLFPELAKASNTWKGVRFEDKRIAISMKDGTVIHFCFRSPSNWSMNCMSNDCWQAKTVMA